jgi:hypothetical protein
MLAPSTQLGGLICTKPHSCMIIAFPSCMLKGLPIAVAGRAVPGMNRLPPLEHWDRGSESHWRHGRLDVCVRLFCVYVVLCVGGGLAAG